jgi:hypothetical protein
MQELTARRISQHRRNIKRVSPYASTPSIRIVGRVPAGREEFLRRRIDPNVGVSESNVRPNNGDGVRVSRIGWLAVDELKCSGGSVACRPTNEYSGRVIGTGQACHRNSSVDLEIPSACTLKVSEPARTDKLEIECIIRA